MRRVLAGSVAFSFLVPLILAGADGPSKGDWPQWRGPDRNGICTETRLVKEWPKDGPKLLWDSKKINGGRSVGTGFSSMSITQGKIFRMGDGKGDGGFVYCLDAASGKELWATKLGSAQGDGPRCTPTVDGDRVYALTRQGNLGCFRVSDGSIVWQKEFKKDFGGRMMSGWDYSESPLVDGDKLVCTPGGKEAALIALNKMTGEVIWKCPISVDCGAGYASIVTADVGGIRQYITLLGPQLGLIGVDAKTGKLLWNYKKVANGTANIPT